MPDLGYNYFPADIGVWVVYDVDSIVYNDFTDSVETYNYQIKEIVESAFIDGEGRETRRLERYIRLTDTLPWSINDVWFANRTASRAAKNAGTASKVVLRLKIRILKTDRIIK